MPESKKSPILEAFQEAVKSQIGDNRNHGWGAKDSMAVIDAVVAADASEEIEKLVKEGKQPGAYSLSAEATEFIEQVINPSAFRQKLESAKRPDGQTVLAKSEKNEREKRTLALYS